MTVKTVAAKSSRLPSCSPYMLLVLGIAFYTVLGLGPGHTHGEEPEEHHVIRLAFRLQRFEEGWSSLAGLDRSKTGDLFDPIKYIPLGDDGSVWASFGGTCARIMKTGIISTSVGRNRERTIFC